MNETFIWLSGHRIIENNPVMGYSKTFFIPEAKGLKIFCDFQVYSQEFKKFKHHRILKALYSLFNCFPSDYDLNCIMKMNMSTI